MLLSRAGADVGQQPVEVRRGPSPAGPAARRPDVAAATARAQAAAWAGESSDQPLVAAPWTPPPRRLRSRRVSAVSTPTYLVELVACPCARPERHGCRSRSGSAAGLCAHVCAPARAGPVQRGGDRAAVSEPSAREPDGHRAGGPRPRPPPVGASRRAPRAVDAVGDRRRAAPVRRHRHVYRADPRVVAVGEHLVDEVGGPAVGRRPGQRRAEQAAAPGEAPAGSSRSGSAGVAGE